MLLKAKKYDEKLPICAKYHTVHTHIHFVNMYISYSRRENRIFPLCYRWNLVGTNIVSYIVAS